MTFPRRRLEPVAQRVRARIGKRIILDTTRAQLLFEDERHPWPAIPKGALPPGDVRSGVELPGTAARGREPGRAHRHSR